MLITIATRFQICLVCCTASLFPALHAQDLVCAPSAPVAFPGDSIRLYAWGNLPDGAKPIYAWTISSGEVTSSGANSFTWKLAPGFTGPATADGELRKGSQVQARCLVEVQAVASHPVPAGSGFLVSLAREAEGAGLYNYLLIAGPPARGSQDALRSALEAWIRLNTPVAALRRILKPGEPISLSIPVVASPPPQADATWVLDHYDFAGARSFLEKIMPLPRSGVLIVSSLQPIAKSRPPYLMQDLSSTTPAIASQWVEAFINVAAQEHSWTPASQASLLDQLRSTVSALARQMPGFSPALPMKWITLR